MMKNDTIAALSTPLSTGGIGVIRISGDDAIPVVTRIFKGKDDLLSVPSPTVHYGHIVEKTGVDNYVENLVDEVLISVFKSPRTYTREDVVEISCHGGIYIMKKILFLLFENGVRPAEPGEFTKRAFLNGRIDLSEAEAVMDLISSSNESAHKNAISQLSGELKRRISGFREEILHETAFIEAALDDPEHYELDGYGEKLELILDKLREQMQHLADTFDEGVLIRDGIKTAIVGRPNAGKSSLLNALLQRERAIVTDIPGTTRDTIEETLNLGGMTLRLVDTAGLRETEDTVEMIGVERSKRSVKEAQLVLYVIDSSVGFHEEDRDQLDGFLKDDDAGSKNYVLILNKSDIGQDSDIELIRSEVSEFAGEIPVITVSAKERFGIDDLTETIREMFFSKDLSGDNGFYLTGERERAQLLSAIRSLDLVKDAIDSGMPEDMFAVDLMDAYTSLGAILGEKIEDDLADMIFSEFCMGK